MGSKVLQHQRPTHLARPVPLWIVLVFNATIGRIRGWPGFHHFHLVKAADGDLPGRQGVADSERS